MYGCYQYTSDLFQKKNIDDLAVSRLMLAGLEIVLIGICDIPKKMTVYFIIAY